MRKPVVKWNSEDVAGWVEGLGDWGKHNYSEIFRKEVCVDSCMASLASKLDPATFIMWQPVSKAVEIEGLVYISC